MSVIAIHDFTTKSRLSKNSLCTCITCTNIQQIPGQKGMPIDLFLFSQDFGSIKEELWEKGCDPRDVIKLVRHAQPSLLTYNASRTKIQSQPHHFPTRASFPGLPLLFCITGLGANAKNGGKPGNEATSTPPFPKLVIAHN